MSINSEKSTRKFLTVSYELLEEIDKYRFTNHVKTESEAIRSLIMKGLEVGKEEPKEKRS